MIPDREKAVMTSANADTDVQRERREQCWIRTQAELDEGLIFGPLSHAQLDRWYGSGPSANAGTDVQPERRE
jgi:hypothetical protein